MTIKEQPHSGHRQRLKNRFDRHGLDSFSDLNALELLLFYALPRQDTNPLAHALLERFGSLDAVLEAEPEELKGVAGMGENAALLLRLIPAISRRYLIRKSDGNTVIDDPESAGEYLFPHFCFRQEELIFALYLDSRFHVLDCEELNRGVVDAVDIGVRALVNRALELQSSFVVLAHNHPSGVDMPSIEDEAATLRIRQALSAVGISLCDHLVFAGNSYMSMSEVGML